MARNAILLIAGLLAGCTVARDPEKNVPASTMFHEIQSIIAKQLGKSAAEIDPDRTFAATGADDLDLVEITMEVEEKFQILIKDESLMHAANITDANALCDKLTVRKFAAVAEQSPKQPPPQSSAEVPDDGALKESQVGTFGVLSQRPNPKGLVLVFVPSLEQLMQVQEQRLGRRLDEREVEELRQKAPVIALPQEMADRVNREKSKREK